MVDSALRIHTSLPRCYGGVVSVYSHFPFLVPSLVCLEMYPFPGHNRTGWFAGMVDRRLCSILSELGVSPCLLLLKVSFGSTHRQRPRCLWQEDANEWLLERLFHDGIVLPSMDLVFWSINLGGSGRFGPMHQAYGRSAIAVSPGISRRPW